MILVYHTAFRVCLVVFILLILLAVFLFFKFNIPNNFKVRTGLAANKVIRRVNETNKRSGRLRYNSVALGVRTPVSLPKSEAAEELPAPQAEGQSEEPASREVAAVAAAPEVLAESPAVEVVPAVEKRPAGLVQFESEVLFEPKGPPVVSAELVKATTVKAAPVIPAFPLQALQVPMVRGITRVLTPTADMEPTTLLEPWQQPGEETTLLYQAQGVLSSFEILRGEIYVHTDEVIP